MRIFKRKKKWWIDYSHHGERIRVPVSTSKAEAEQVMAKIRADIIFGRYDLPPQKNEEIQFVELAKKYFENHVEPKHRSKRSTISRLKPLVSHFGQLPINKITGNEIDGYIAWRSGQESVRKRPISGATVNREIEVLCNMMRKAYEWGYLSRPMGRRPGKFPERQRERILNLDEMARLLACIEQEMLRDIILVALNTGMRKMEILSMKFEQVNLDAGYIYVEETKTDNPRRIPMNESIKELFSRLLRERGGREYVFAGPEAGTHVVDVRKSFATALKRAGITHFRFHDLRHTFATYALQNGCDIYSLSRILGHKSITTTMRYLSATSSGMQKVVDCFVVRKNSDKLIGFPMQKHG